METITPKEFALFCKKVAQAREMLGITDTLHPHDFAHYCQVLINGAGVFQLLASMHCSDRIDLVDSDETGANRACDALEAKFKQFTKDYLGLELVTSGDPRGAVWKLVVNATLGDSFGDRTHLCVPCVDAYQNFV